MQFNQASLDEERFLKQKAKIHWLAVGDSNNSYFHNSLKCKTHCNRVDRVTDANGLLHEGGDVPMAFVNHFEQFLGADYSVSMPVSPDLFVNRLEEDAAVNMIRPVSELRPVVKPFFWSTLGDGSNTYAWFDTWCNLGSLDTYLSPRMIANGGYDIKTKGMS
ncbi:hypothetical protein QVD17_06915 [Tagetes erecta]|uniref:Uncharacterized protein n=1 Tax=Tagetes erecta TaxID=13708 RepID=A0AAD8PBP3_TARER|nr:hypothetical protein QVD17_06915 [Tagetes erecta]